LIGYVIVWYAWPAAPEVAVIAISLIAGVSAGVIAYFNYGFGRLALGAVAGICFVMWVLCFRPVVLLQTPWALNLTVSLVALASAYLTFYKQVPDDKYPIIISSCFSGAYAIVCGIDFFVQIGVCKVFLEVIRGTYYNLPQES
jgi:hypothetical protein